MSKIVNLKNWKVISQISLVISITYWLLPIPEDISEQIFNYLVITPMYLLYGLFVVDPFYNLATNLASRIYFLVNLLPHIIFYFFFLSGILYGLNFLFRVLPKKIDSRFRKR